MVERYRREHLFPYGIAIGYVGLGDYGSALDWLERAVEVRDPSIPLYLLSDPMLDPLRSDARFKRLLRRVGLG